MTEAIPKNLFLQSLERCSEDEDFIASFYDNFLGASEEVREKFAETDFTRQNRMLLKSLRLCAGATAGDLAALRELRERAETHDRQHLNIRPELYDLWLDAIIKTAREYDELWSPDIEEAWNTILGHVIHHMIKYY